MKKLLSLMLAAMMAFSVMAIASAEDATWAYAGITLDGMGTVWYTDTYFALEGIVNPLTAAPYTEEELAAVIGNAAEGAEGYRFDVPADAMLGFGFADSDAICWYDAENAAAITSHADPLSVSEDGVFTTAEGEVVASPIVNWAYAGISLEGMGTVWYAKAYFALEGIVNPLTAAPYTEEELAAVMGNAAEGAEGYRFDVPALAMLGFETEAGGSTFWYDAANCAAITSHADPLSISEDGTFATADGEVVASPME